MKMVNNASNTRKHWYMNYWRDMIDERVGRRAAQGMQHEFAGTTGVLAIVLRKGLLERPYIEECVRVLRGSGRRIGAELPGRLASADWERARAKRPGKKKAPSPGTPSAGGLAAAIIAGKMVSKTCNPRGCQSSHAGGAGVGLRPPPHPQVG